MAKRSTPAEDLALEVLTAPSGVTARERQLAAALMAHVQGAEDFERWVLEHAVAAEQETESVRRRRMAEVGTLKLGLARLRSLVANRLTKLRGS